MEFVSFPSRWKITRQEGTHKVTPMFFMEIISQRLIICGFCILITRMKHKCMLYAYLQWFPHKN